MTSETKLFSLKDYNISPERGILPDPDPADEELPGEYGYWWQETARDLRKLLAAGPERTRKTIDEMPVLPYILDPKHDEQCMLMLSTLGHGYVWADPDHPAQKLSASVAVPWCGVAERLNMRAVLSYSSIALQNWRRLNEKEPITLDNLAILQNFFGGLDEDWFILIHIAWEAKGGLVWDGIEHVINHVLTDVEYEVEIGYEKIAAGLEAMHTIFFRMKERCDPYIYYNRLRPFLYGWTDKRLFPNGLYYEGVETYQRYRGESGAYTPTAYALFAILDVDYEEKDNEEGRVFARITQEIKNAMPPIHKRVVKAIESYRKRVSAYARSHPRVLNAITSTRELFDRYFLALHENFAKEYIAKQIQNVAGNPTDIGTSDTPFVSYLKRHREAIRKQYPPPLLA